MSRKNEDPGTLAERVREAFNNLPPDENNKKWSMNALAKKYGFNATLFSRTMNGGRVHVHDKTIEQLATALKASPEWLRSGRGEPPTYLAKRRDETHPAQSVELTDRYASRAQVIEMARGQGVKPHILRALGIEALESEEDPGRGYWIERLAELIRDERKLVKEIKHFMVLEGEDPTKPDL